MLNGRVERSMDKILQFCLADFKHIFFADNFKAGFVVSTWILGTGAIFSSFILKVSIYHQACLRKHVFLLPFFSEANRNYVSQK